MNVFRLSIIPGTRNDIAWRLMTPRFFRRFPDESLLVRAKDEERAREIVSDGFPLIMPQVDPDSPTPFLTPDQLLPWRSAKFSACTLEREEKSDIEGIIE